MYNKKKNTEYQDNFLLFIYLLASFYMIFGQLIQYGSSYFDEFLVLLLAVYGFCRVKIYFKKDIRITFLVLIGYLMYSCLFGANIIRAAFLDFILFCKPFISFFVALSCPLNLQEKKKRYLRRIYIVIGIFIWMFTPYINNIYPNTAKFYHVCIACAVSYLLFSKGEKKDWIVAFAILIPGLFTNRAKYFTEFLFFVFLAFFLKGRIKFNVKWATVISSLVVLAIYISREKFFHYFVEGNEETARTIFYLKSLEIFQSYFPFGSGFGSFGTEAAARYYSPIYFDLGVDTVFGMRQQDYKTTYDFLKDTFYPCLAQFGIVGLFLYIYFWIRIWKNTYRLNNTHYYKLSVFIILVVTIQNIAANSFTGNDSIFYMMFLGIVLSSSYNKTNGYKSKHNRALLQS